MGKKEVTLSLFIDFTHTHTHAHASKDVTKKPVQTNKQSQQSSRIPNQHAKLVAHVNTYNEQFERKLGKQLHL